jgi:hypothetical protein
MRRPLLILLVRAVVCWAAVLLPAPGCVCVCWNAVTVLLEDLCTVLVLSICAGSVELGIILSWPFFLCCQMNF